MEDMAPGLIEAVSKQFKAEMQRDPELEEKLQAVLNGSTHYSDALDFSDRVGQCLKIALQESLAEGVLPDDTLYYNIAKRLIDEVGGSAYDLAADAGEAVLSNINTEAGLGLKAISADTKAERLTGLVNAVSGKPLAEALPTLTGAAQALPLGAAGDTLKANAEFQGKSGLRPKIVRTYHHSGHHCAFCAGLAGTYEYPVQNNDVYRRHENCRCTVEYDPGKGNRQNVWSKQWTTHEEHAKIEARKAIGIEKIPVSLIIHPARLASYTPESLKTALEQAGYEVSPLKKGSLRGIAFEDGGGFKCNFEDGGLLQYHPANKSHHNGAYYKISTGKGGIHRYDLDGTEKKE